MLVGAGCGVPGIMASRTIENEKDRRMTIMTTTFIPCGAKVPFIAMIAGAIFGGSSLVATSQLTSSVLQQLSASGIMLKEDKDVRRRSCSIRYGAYLLTICPTVGYCTSVQYVGAWLVIH